MLDGTRLRGDGTGGAGEETFLRTAAARQA